MHVLKFSSKRPSATIVTVTPGMSVCPCCNRTGQLMDVSALNLEGSYGPVHACQNCRHEIPALKRSLPLAWYWSPDGRPMNFVNREEIKQEKCADKLADVRMA